VLCLIDGKLKTVTIFITNICIMALVGHPRKVNPSHKLGHGISWKDEGKIPSKNFSKVLQSYLQ
jgi:hypothetical protein